MDKKDWLSFVAQEYSSVRQDIVNAGKNSMSILKFGIATLSVVLSTGFSLWDKEQIPEFIFLVLSPALCYLILTIWIGEFARKLRAGKFIKEVIEKKLNDEFKDLPPCVHFETWIREKDEKGKTRLFKWNRKATIILFLIVAIISIAAGYWKFVNEHKCDDKLVIWIIIISFCETISFIAAIFYIYSVGKNLE